MRCHLSLFRGVVYDLGCGERPYEADISRVATQYVGVDWSNTIHTLRADIIADLNERLPIADSVADTVVSFQVLEHLSEPQTMLDEAHRILRRGGRIVLTVPFQWWVHEAPYDYFRFTSFGLLHMLSKAGFADIIVEPTSGFWTMWILKLNYQTVRLVRGPMPMRVLARAILVPMWFLGQVMAPLLDRVWPSPEETVGYLAFAHKP